MPGVEEQRRRRVGAGFEQEDAAVPVLPVRVGDRDAEIFGDRLAQVVAGAVEDALAGAVDPLSAPLVEAVLALLCDIEGHVGEDQAPGLVVAPALVQAPVEAELTRR